MNGLYVLLMFIAMYAWGGVARPQYEIGNFMDRTHTNLLRGLSIILITICHIEQALGVLHVQYFAAAGVAIFLVVSGYGITKSYQKKGLQGFWKGRLVSVILPYYFIRILMFPCLNYPINFSTVIEVLVLKSAWFVLHVTILYASFYLAVSLAMIFKWNFDKAILLICLFAVFYFVIDSLFFYGVGDPSLKTRQLIPFISGVLLAYDDNKLEKLKNRKIFKSLTYIGIGLFLYFLAKIIFSKTGMVFISNIASVFSMGLMALGIISLTFRYRKILQNRMVECFGIFSYELYLIQGAIMIFIATEPTYVIAYSIATICVSYVIHNMISDAQKRIRLH